MPKIYSWQDIYRTLGYQLVRSVSDNRALLLSIAEDKSNAFDNELFFSDMALIEILEKSLLSGYAETLEKLSNKWAMVG